MKLTSLFFALMSSVNASEAPVSGGGQRVFNPGHICLDIAATRTAFEARWPKLRSHFTDASVSTSLANNIGAGLRMPNAEVRVQQIEGFFDRQSLQCWVVVADPNALTTCERELIEHEHLHRWIYLEGFDYDARLIAADLRERAPELMTHPDINRQLAKSEKEVSAINP